MLSRLEGLGINITHDWTRVDESIGDNADAAVAGAFAAMDIQGVIDSDVYILVSDHEVAGKGMHAELGAALAVRQLLGKPEIFIVGPRTQSSIFCMHPGVVQLESIDLLIGCLQTATGSDSRQALISA